MLDASPSPRTRMCTWLARRDRNTAACPAELPPANDGRVVAFAQLRFDRGGGVVHPTALELGDIGQRKAAVARTRGNDDGVRVHLGAVV